MKKIEREKTIKEIVGYESEDGKVFATEEECRKYEESAEKAITYAFQKILIGQEFPETSIWEDYGYGSEEWKMAVVNLQTENDLRILNQYLTMRKGKLVSPEYIGNKILIDLGYDYDQADNPRPRTEEELVEQFKKSIHKYFECGDTERS